MAPSTSFLFLANLPSATYEKIPIIDAFPLLPFDPLPFFSSPFVVPRFLYDAFRRFSNLKKNKLESRNEFHFPRGGETFKRKYECDLHAFYLIIIYI